jgi:hypothetical protein
MEVWAKKEVNGVATKRGRGERVTRGMLEYSLDVSQAQAEELEAEGTYLKTKINLKIQSHNLHCAG